MNYSRWQRYVTKNEKAYFTVPNKFTKNILSILPEDIDSILEIGCTNGRDFKQFENKYKLYGTDIFPKKNIDWVCDGGKINYYQTTLAEFINVLDKEEFKDLSKFVFLSHFTLCYDRNKSILILKKLIKQGCKNIIIKEPLHGDYKYQKLDLLELNKLFVKKKSGWQRSDSTHICCYVDNNEEKIKDYLEKSVDPNL